MNEYGKKYAMLKIKNIEDIISGEQKVVSVAKKMNVSRQTIHKWVNRYKRFGMSGLVNYRRKKKGPPPNKTNPELESVIAKFSEDYWYDGVQLLSDRIFAERKISISPSTIYRVLKRNGVRYDNFYHTTKRRQKKKLYSHKEAGKELQMDTKYPFGYKIGVVVYTVIDDASRWTCARMYSTANAENSVDFIKNIMKVAPFDILKIRTDCGTEFLNGKTLNLLRELGIEHHKNTPYCPEENGKIERFHRTLNEKAISLFWFPSDSLETLEYKLQQFLHWYNYEKRHRGMGMNGMTPMEKLSFLSLKSVNLTLRCNKT